MSDTDLTSGLERFTLNARKVINDGYYFAKRNQSKEYLPIHLFYSLIQDKGNIVEDILQRIGVDIENTVRQIQLRVKFKSTDSKDDKLKITNPVFSIRLKEILNESFLIASDMNHVYVGSEHLLLSFFRVKNIEFIEDLKKLGVDYNSLKKILKSLSGSLETLGIKDQLEDKGKGQSSLPFFCKDMNEISEKGEYPVITGRDSEIQRLIHILSRKTKNNPILVGEAGVGKTAIVEGFVNKIIAGDVPSSFLEKKILNLEIAAILSGARLRGDVEERISAVIEDALEDGDTIVFIDEIHNIVGAGSSGGKDSLDIANLLKPYLTGSKLSVIGATTSDEYNRYFETDSALARRFQPIKVEELDVESSKKVIYNLKNEFENYHRVKIKPESIDTAVEMSKKFIQDRFLPDKAIDLIDEAAASLKIGREVAIDPELNKLGEKLIKIQHSKTKAIESKNLDKAEKYKSDEDKVISEIEDVIDGKKSVKKKYAKVVTSNLIKDIIVRWTGIPIVASNISDKTLKDLPENLRARVVGQDHVIENSARIIQKSHLGLNDPRRPLGSFLFLGPTGVGKTELAKMMAKELFGSADLIYQINMSEFMEVHSVAKLIGAPPGYVGHQEGGQLTSYVRRKPYSVILFDEIEKAHPDTLNILLQILEEGSLSDGKGSDVSFKNCIIVMTSNIGADAVSNDNRLGFDIAADNEAEALKEAYNEMRDRIMDDLKRSVRPEFLNRIDLIDVFRGLNKEDTLKVTRTQVDDLILRLITNGIILNVSDEVVDYINNEGYNKDFGGRNIRRKVQEVLEDGLAGFLLSQNYKKGSKKDKVLRVKVSFVENKVEFKLDN
ncbi:MAG: ATP-dependent Clp protease ATP-binding subunit [Candidatus Dojkabacteria bacterium]|nr:ATP-dependent Clp protease ATP-binding subunit [Candidatus Dojkabacteria bacterium]